jgi:Ca2+-binding EF-hand superfamily protein
VQTLFVKRKEIYDFCKAVQHGMVFISAIFTSGNFNPNEIDDLFKLVDANNDGKIEYKGNRICRLCCSFSFLLQYKY